MKNAYRLVHCFNAIVLVGFYAVSVFMIIANYFGWIDRALFK